MKKTLFALICFLLLSNSVIAADKNIKTFLNSGISSYKSENYIESIRILENVVTKDPGNSMARYYLAMSYVQVGKIELAINEYNNVIKLNPNSQLAKFAEEGISKISGNKSPAASPANFSRSENKLPTIKNKESLKKSEIDINKEYVKNPSNNQPTDQEIANAMKVLAKAGINNGMNSESMKMNMLMNSLGGFGNSNNNNMWGGGNNNMLPYMLMLQGQSSGQNNNNQQLNKELLNSMMMSSMFSGGMGLGN